MLELVVAVCIVVSISAISSIFEAALYSVPIAHVEAMAQRDLPSGRILRRLKEKIDEPIAVILLLNTVSNTAGASITGYLAARALGEGAIIYFSAAISLLILIFAEVIPKTVGVVYARALAGPVALPIYILVVVFKPVLLVLGLITGVIRRSASEDAVSDEHLIALAKLGRREGVLRKDEAAVIENVLALDSKFARDVLTPRTVLFALKHDETVGDVWKEKGVWRHTRAPVYEGTLDKVVGIVHRADVLGAVAGGQLDTTVGSLAKPIYFVPETIRLDRLLRTFLKRKQHMFAVADEYGGLEGVVTLEDVLEEILGQEIVDEYDEIHDMQEHARQRAASLRGESDAPDSGAE